MKQKRLLDEEDLSEELNDDPGDPSDEQLESSIIEWGEGGNASDFKNIYGASDIDDEDYYYYKELNEKLDDIFNKSRWIALNPNKKVPKDLIPMIFQDLFDELESTKFTYVEKFVTICDYMSITYNKAYECIHMKYKEKIVLEMEEKHQVLSKKKIKRVF